MANALTSPKFILAFLILVFALNLAGVAYGFYESISWLDNLHHFLGGFWIGILAFYLARTYPRVFSMSDSWFGVFFGVLALTALAGVAWEIYEFMFYDVFAIAGSPPPTQFNHGDTISDLVFDLLGAMAAVFLVRKPRSRG